MGPVYSSRYGARASIGRGPGQYNGPRTIILIWLHFVPEELFPGNILKVLNLVHFTVFLSFWPKGSETGPKTL